MTIPVDSANNEVYKPLIISASGGGSGGALERLKADKTLNIHDEINSQVGDLIKLQNPSKKYTSAELEDAVKVFYDGKSSDDYGNWVYYPWSHRLVHLLPEDEFINVRTIRNKYVISEEEQIELASKKIGIIGLSVGQSVTLTLAMERGCGELRLADFDTLELSNLNRIRTGVHNLGVKKSVATAREIAEIDPYLNVVLYNEGIHEENINDFFSTGGQLDLLIEECDNLEMKIKSRLKAKELHIPVLMDTSDRGMVDVERFDLSPDRPIFHGMLSKFGEEKNLLVDLEEKRSQLLMTILDFDNLSERAKFSISEMGKSITTWPQLASSVIMGGAMIAYFSKSILCAKSTYSGRIYVDLDEMIIARDENKS